MKAKITYLLLNAARGSLPHSPHPVSGASGKLYGHANFSKEYNTHVLEMSQEAYEGRPAIPPQPATETEPAKPGVPAIPGADLDIANNAHRSFGKWMVRVKTEVEFDEAETGMANEIDRLNGLCSQLRAAGEQLAADLITAEGMIEKLSRAPQAAKPTPAKVQAPAPVTVPVGGTDLHSLTRETQEQASYAELKVLAKERGLDWGSNPSPKRTVLIDLLWPIQEPVAV